jgi:hypothetical protein
MFKPQQWDEALAAEREIQARDERAVAVHPKPETVRHLEISKGEISSIRGDLAGIHEECPVKQP